MKRVKQLVCSCGLANLVQPENSLATKLLWCPTCSKATAYLARWEDGTQYIKIIADSGIRYYTPNEFDAITKHVLQFMDSPAK